MVTQAFDFEHGVFLGALAASETTAAALDLGQTLRRDPFAMLPFCGYNMADYWTHWYAMGDKLGANAPAVFYVNWFRTSRDGRWLWPGFGENSRVLKWMCERVEGKVGARQTPIGQMPLDGDFDLSGLEIPAEDWAELMEVDTAAYRADMADAEAYLAQFGDKVPRVSGRNWRRRSAAGLIRRATAAGVPRRTAASARRFPCCGDAPLRRTRHRQGNPRNEENPSAESTTGGLTPAVRRDSGNDEVFSCARRSRKSRGWVFTWPRSP